MEQKRAAIAAAESRIEEATSKLALAKQQLARTEVRADVPGIVVYKDVFFGSEQRKPQVGDQVWANQPLLILPDISKMVVETKVRETDIHKVEKNQKVTVRVEAYPDLKLTGKVTLVGTLAQEEKERRGHEVLRRHGPDQRVRAAPAAGHDRARRDPGRGAARRPSSCPSRRCSSATAAPSSTCAGGVWSRGRSSLGPSNQDFVVVERGLRGGAGVPARPRRAPLGLRRVTTP